jgi:FKBP-type peptidyl-prolyl cis-trans isomerase (trigger factor)
MKLPISVRAAALALGLSLAFASPTARAAAADTKTYQVTGPVVEVTDTTITIMKGKEKWQIARDKDAKVTGGELKVGSKVTIEYTMSAKDIEVKGAAKPDKAAAKPEK